MTVETRLPFWRSMLFVPADNERFLAKAYLRGADAIILDLEDSIPPASKTKARQHCANAIQDLLANGQKLIIRINMPLRLAVRDLETVILPGVRAIMLPKARSADHVRMISTLIGTLETERNIAERTIGLLPIIETAAAYFRAEGIARADPRVIGLLLGAEDFAADTGLVPTPDALKTAKQQIVFAAAAAGIRPYGLLGSVADYGDRKALNDMAARSAEFGFVGATCIHPSGVPILNEGFTPAQEQIADAKSVIAALEDAERRGLGAVAHNGRMIDAPVAARARDLLARANLFSEN
ncbi:MAG: HpcH/HpaI aldolase/citrate lyase family protein [Methyloligellaceae bacterium]